MPFHGLDADDGGMRERTILVGAEIRIGARVGGGTEVRLVVPVRQASTP